MGAAPSKDISKWEPLFTQVGQKPPAFYKKVAARLESQDLYEVGDLLQVDEEYLVQQLTVENATTGEMTFLRQVLRLAKASSGTPRPSSHARGTSPQAPETAPAGFDTERPNPAWICNRPKHWATDGKSKPYEHRVEDLAERSAVLEYFMKHGGQFIKGLKVYDVLRNENMKKYAPYGHYRATLDHGGNEKWLFHGTTNKDLIVTNGNGFLIAHSSKHFNILGVGTYFAGDVRLAHFFACGASKCHALHSDFDPSVDRFILVTRVAVGKCHPKERVFPGTPGNPRSEKEWQDELTKAEHLMAPLGFDSCINDETRAELTVYNDFHAYPAYIIVYRADEVQDPYKNPLLGQLQTIETAQKNSSCVCILP